MGYYFYYPFKNKIFVSQNTEFFENSFMVQEASGSHGLLEMNGSDKGLEIIQEEDTQPSENTSKEHNKVAPIEVETQSVGVPIRRSARIPQVPNRYGYYVDIEEYELGDLNEPPNYKAALTDPESDKWLEAMNMEIQSKKDNQVWYLVNLPSNGLTVGCKWLFKKKTAMDGNVHTFKARLVEKGFTQTYDVDYGETFSPVADIRAIRILLAIAAKHLEVRIKGLMRKSRKLVFSQNPDEPCVYLKASWSNVAFLVLYVDDILLMGNSVTMLQEVKSWLCKCFSMKDLGEATYILGIKIIRDRSKRLIALSQSAYLEKILRKFRMENSKKGYTLMMEKPDYRKSQGAKTPTEQNHDVIHWTVVKTILKYLRNTKDMVLVYRAKPKDELKVSCYADESFQMDKDDIKSQTEAEYIAAAEASMEANLLMDLERKYHYICEVIQEGEIVLKKVHTNDIVADPFTKPMPFSKHFEHPMAIGIGHANEEMHDDETVKTGKDKGEMTVAVEADVEETAEEEVDDELAGNKVATMDQAKGITKLPLTTSSEYVSYRFGNQFLTHSSDISLTGTLKDTAYVMCRCVDMESYPGLLAYAHTTPKLQRIKYVGLDPVE
ncbi:retrotransposon protein, putative, ty1-copia subclass [Tanacetum coccineum]|uniref:Retrotransposon protein, putative, ty1-copia subclass n=1 Tax=Tanacetum coccineum TaxID=301880 RepID=A0ABQ5C120_9ASTR